MQNKKMLALKAVLIAIVATVGIVTLTMAPMVQLAYAPPNCVSHSVSHSTQTPSGRINSGSHSHFNCG
jgi:hypothetical protein